MPLSAITLCFLNASTDGDSTISVGSPFCHLTTIPENFFLASNVDLPWCNSKPFSLVPLLLPRILLNPSEKELLLIVFSGLFFAAVQFCNPALVSP